MLDASTQAPALARLATARVLPIVTVRDPAQAVALTRALGAAGFVAVEIVLRTPGALDAVAAVAGACPDTLVGAGSILDAAQLADAAAAGAQFAVSPGATDRLLDAARHVAVPLIPGVATPAEAMRARDAGYTLLKLFPAGPIGGIPYLRALGGPLPDLRFVPTGGLDATTFRDYLAEPNVACAGGSWMIAHDAVAAEDWARVTLCARERCP